MYGLGAVNPVTEMAQKTRIGQIAAAEHVRLTTWPYPFAKSTYGTYVNKVRALALKEALFQKVGAAGLNRLITAATVPNKSAYLGTAAEMLSKLPAGSEMVDGEVTFVPAGTTPATLIMPEGAVTTQESSGTTGDQAVAPEKKSNLMLYLGLAAGVGAIGYFALRRKGK